MHQLWLGPDHSFPTSWSNSYFVLKGHGSMLGPVRLPHTMSLSHVNHHYLVLLHITDLNQIRFDNEYKDFERENFKTPSS